VSGFFFGLFLSVALLTYGVVALDSIVLALMPIIFLVVGVVWGLWAPLRRRSA
jgi:hypothetical protein